MIKKKLLLLLFTAVALTACEFSYDLEPPTGFKPQIVLTSALMPDHNIEVGFRWSKHINDSQEYSIEGIEGVVELYKDGELLTEKIISRTDTIIDESGVMYYNHLYPTAYYYDHFGVAGSHYKVVAHIKDYGTLEAETTIPHVGSAKGYYDKMIDIDYYLDSSVEVYHYTVTDIEISEELRSVWIVDDTKASPFFYSNSPFIDTFNLTLVNDDYNVGSEVDHVHWHESITSYTDIRIPYSVIDKAFPLKLSAKHNSYESQMVIVGKDEYGNDIYDYIYTPINEIKLRLIFPSDEYDRFYKTAIQQPNTSEFGLFAENVRVYSNVKGGVGIFAGYTSYNIIINIPHENGE